MPIKETRALLAAALNGSLNSAPMTQDPIFGFSVPTKVDGVDERILAPRNTWADPAKYDAQAQKLSAMFVENFKIYEAYVSDDGQSCRPESVTIVRTARVRLSRNTRLSRWSCLDFSIHMGAR